ncbi:MAG: PEP-CTERM sorting domain-containing protein [Phycisphaeraceae bacterium]
MLKRRPASTQALLAAAALLAAGQSATTADAAIVYGDFSDVPPGSVMYTDVTESSSSDPLPPALYGAPSIFGNTLDFDPAGFGASSVGPIPGADITEGQLNFGFEVVTGPGLSGLTLSEGGDYSVFGSGTTTTSVNGGLFAQVDITEVNGVALASPIIVVGFTSFSNDLINSPGLTQPWSQGLTLDFGPFLANAGFDPNVDGVTAGEVVLNNGLVAISEGNPSTVAQIVKKDFKVNPLVVPEPGSIALLALGGLACVTRRRR